MKIALIVFARKDNGGVFQFTRSVIQSLKLDPKNQIIVFTPEEHQSTETYRAEGCEVRTFRLSDFTFTQKIRVVLPSFLPFFALPKIKLPQFSDIDLLYATTPSFYPFAFLEKRRVVTLHDLQECYYPQFFTWKERLKRRVLNSTMERVASAFLVESNFVKKDLIQFLSIDPQKIFINPAPANLSNLNFNPDLLAAEKIKKKYRLSPTYLYYPAQFWPHKNHRTLLKACKKVLMEFPDCTLVFSGSKQNYFHPVMDYAKEIGIQNQVNYLGYVENEEMPYIFQAASMVVIPSLFESISIPIIEAFCLGVPVISARTCALPEQVGDAGLLFDAMNADELAEKIIALLKSPDLRATLIEKGKNRVKMYSNENFLEGFKKLALSN